MAIRERKTKKGTAYEVYWINPITKKQQQRRFMGEREAKRFESKIKDRIEFEPESFAVVEENTPERELASLYALVERYLTDKPMADSTKRDSLCHLKVFWEVMGNPSIESIDKKLMKGFERELRKMEKADGTPKFKQNSIHRKVGIIKAALNWGVDEEIIESHNLAGYKCDKGEDNKIIPPTPEELKAILAVAPEHIQRVIKVSFNFGVRVGQSELFRLKWTDFDLERGVVHIPASQKNKKVQHRRIKIKKSFIEQLEAWKEQDEKTGVKHVIHYKGKPIVHNFRNAWKRALEDAGITRRIRPYDLRHAFATEALASGADLGAVSEILGHADTALTLRTYQHVLDRGKEQAVESLPDL